MSSSDRSVWQRVWLIFAQAVTVAVAVLFVLDTFRPGWLGSLGSVMRQRAAVLPPPTIATTPPARPASTAPTALVVSLAAAAQRATPAVVSIVATRAALRNPHLDDPSFRWFFGQRSPQQQGPRERSPQAGLGSGVIVSPEGYVLTNNHVVEGASEIEVQLADGRQARAQVVGTDPETDLAVLRVELDRLPVVTWGRVETLQVGDAVLAIGNPFNVGMTVTSGIVSALGRNRLGLSTYENFIQTDAAINPGNSGGALVNAQGELIGVNTAIFSRSGGSLGIGFAIPVDTARQVLEALVKDGQVTRGWLGVETRDLTPEFAEAFKLPVATGALITGVLENGAAGVAGVKPGDVVLKVGASVVTNSAQLLAAVAVLKPQTKATLTVQRGAVTQQLEVTVAQRPKPRNNER